MRLKFLTLAFIIGVSSSSSPILSMDDAYDAVGEFESRKSRGALRYLHKKKEKARSVRTEESGSDDEISAAPKMKTPSLSDYDGDTESITEPRESLTLKVNRTDLPKMVSKRGGTAIIPSDPLEITITLADGKPYECGSKGAEIDISDFTLQGNRHVGRFDIHIKDRTRHILPDAKALLYKNHGNQTLSRCKFDLSSKVDKPTVSIRYDRDSRKFFASGLWPVDRRVN